jgi:hypothetical protein
VQHKPHRRSGLHITVYSTEEPSMRHCLHLLPRTRHVTVVLPCSREGVWSQRWLVVHCSLVFVAAPCGCGGGAMQTFPRDRLPSSSWLKYVVKVEAACNSETSVYRPQPHVPTMKEENCLEDYCGDDRARCWSIVFDPRRGLLVITLGMCSQVMAANSFHITARSSFAAVPQSVSGLGTFLRC